MWWIGQFVTFYISLPYKRPKNPYLQANRLGQTSPKENTPTATRPSVPWERGPRKYSSVRNSCNGEAVCPKWLSLSHPISNYTCRIFIASLLTSSSLSLSHTHTQWLTDISSPNFWSKEARKTVLGKREGAAHAGDGGLRCSGHGE